MRPVYLRLKEDTLLHTVSDSFPQPEMRSDKIAGQIRSTSLQFQTIKWPFKSNSTLAVREVSGK